MPLMVTVYAAPLPETATGVLARAAGEVKTWKSVASTPVTLELKFTAYVTLVALALAARGTNRLMAVTSGAGTVRVSRGSKHNGVACFSFRGLVGGLWLWMRENHRKRD